MGKGLSFRKIPSNPLQAQVWLSNSGRADLMHLKQDQLKSSVFFCDLHFEKEMFLNPEQKRRTLVWNAVPTVFDHGGAVVRMSNPKKAAKKPEDNNEMKRKIEETQQYIDLKLKERRDKAENVKKVKRLRTMVATKRKSAERAKAKAERFKEDAKSKAALDLAGKVIDEYLPPQYASLLKNQFKNSIKKKNCYSDDVKLFLIGLLHRSPRSYRYLSKTMQLPTPRTVKRWINRIFFQQGIDPLMIKMVQGMTSAFSES